MKGRGRKGPTNIESSVADCIRLWLHNSELYHTGEVHDNALMQPASVHTFETAAIGRMDRNREAVYRLDYWK